MIIIGSYGEQQLPTVDEHIRPAESTDSRGCNAHLELLKKIAETCFKPPRHHPRSSIREAEVATSPRMDSRNLARGNQPAQQGKAPPHAATGLSRW